MEPQEAQELREHAEDGAQKSAMRPVAFTMSLLAVLVAVATVLGHRAHTSAVLDQNKATDQWNLYQAKKIRASNTALMADLLKVVTVTDKQAAAQVLKTYADHQAKWDQDLAEEQKKAEELEREVAKSEARATHYDLSEALLEIGLVVTSVTLLTRSRIYWYLGMVFSAAGVVASIAAYFVQ